MCSIPELKPLELYIGTNEAQSTANTQSGPRSQRH